MTMWKVLSGALLLLFVGCRSCPPLVENGRCLFPKQEVSLVAPPAPPWYPSEDVPDRFLPRNQSAQMMLGAFSELVFVNDLRNGAMAFETKKRFRDLGALPPQRIDKILRDEQEVLVGRIEALPFVSDYQFEISAGYVTETPQLLLHQTCRLKSQRISYHCEVDLYAYTIDEDDTMIFTAILWSSPSTYEQNKATFDAVMKTMRRYTPRPEGALAEEELAPLSDDDAFAELWPVAAQRVRSGGAMMEDGNLSPDE